MEDTKVKPFAEACSNLGSEIMTLIASARGLIIRAEEEAPLSVPVGITLDDQQNEVLENVKLALRHLEDAGNRVGIAGVLFVGAGNDTGDRTDTETTKDEAGE